MKKGKPKEKVNKGKQETNKDKKEKPKPEPNFKNTGQVLSSTLHKLYVEVK